MKTNQHFVISVVVVLFLTILLLIYFLSPPIAHEYLHSIVDLPFCTQNVSRRLGISNNYSSIKKYIIDSLKPGMSRNDVMKTLTSIAPITVSGRMSLDNGFGEDIDVNICSSPLNNLTLFVIYSNDGELIQVHDLYSGL